MCFFDKFNKRQINKAFDTRLCKSYLSCKKFLGCYFMKTVANSKSLLIKDLSKSKIKNYNHKLLYN